MKLINKNSKTGIVNLFADFILNKIDKEHNTVIEVYDFGHFYVVDGKTSSKDVLNLSDIKDEFISTYGELFSAVENKKSINIMDLISYDDKEIKSSKSLWFEYYDSLRPLYHYKLEDFNFENNQIQTVDYDFDYLYETKLNDTLSNSRCRSSSMRVKSNFPHGFSLSMGRKFLYYGEYISCNIKNSFISNKISIFMTENENGDIEDNLKVYVDLIYDRDIKSLILDNFDFKLESFVRKFDNYNFCDDLLKPFEEKFWLESNIHKRDLIII